MNSSPLIHSGLPTPPGDKTNPIPAFTSLYIQNEISKNTNPNLRFRNRSQDPITPRDMSSPRMIFPTPESPKKKLNSSSYHLNSPDSGIDTTYYATPKRQLEPEFENENESVESPLDYFQRRFYNRKRTALFNSDSGNIKPHHFLPVIIVIVILASAIFTLFTFKAAIGRNYDEQGNLLPSNGKYKSMEFAVKSWVKKVQDSGKPLPGDIKDDNGKMLTGKKAAIGYAHALQRRALENGDLESDTEEMNSEIENLEVPKMPTQEEKIKRKMLLDKIAKSGQVKKPKTVHSKPEAEDIEEKEEIKPEMETEEVNPPIIEPEVDPETEKKDDGSKTETKYYQKGKKQNRKLKPVQTMKLQTPFDVDVGPRSETSGLRAEDDEDPFRFF